MSAPQRTPEHEAAIELAYAWLHHLGWVTRAADAAPRTSAGDVIMKVNADALERALVDMSTCWHGIIAFLEPEGAAPQPRSTRPVLRVIDGGRT